MLGIKQVLFLCLCDGGCFVKIFGMGPGLVSMSPHRRSSRCALCFLCVILNFLCL